MDGPRAVTAAELPLVEELVDGVFRLPDNLPPVMFALFPRVFCAENTQHIKAIFDGSRPVAVVSYVCDEIVTDGCIILTASIASVATRPEYRNKGLSTLLFDDCLGEMRREGVRIIFVSGDRGLYRRFGCHPGGVVWVARLRRGELPLVSQAIVRPIEGGEAVPVLWPLQMREDPRFQRSEEEFRQLFQAESFAGAFGYQSRAWLILREGRPIAYAILGVRTGKEHAGRMLEYAGDRRALAESLATVMTRLDLEDLEIAVPHDDHALLERLRMRGDWQVQSMPGTMRLLDPAGFWEDLLPRSMQRLGEAAACRLVLSAADGGVSIALGQEAVILHDSERLIELVFGASGTVQAERPLPANLQHALAACFPLPLPWLQGLNYV